MPDRFTAGNSDQQHRDGTARNSGLPRSPPDGSPDADPRAGSASPRPDLGSQPESNGGGSTTRSETGTGGSLHPQHHVTRDKGGGGLLQIKGRSGDEHQPERGPGEDGPRKKKCSKQGVSWRKWTPQETKVSHRRSTPRATGRATLPLGAVR